MAPKILLTSFQPWLSHHTSNASDDLLQCLQSSFGDDSSLIFLRHLPVDVTQAYQNVLEVLSQQQIHGIISCGMAEKRKKLNLESCAVWQQKKLETSVDLLTLADWLSWSEISHDAGKFVCEGLYYHLLEKCQYLTPQPLCLFVHVPLLTSTNQDLILRDFQQILRYFKSALSPAVKVKKTEISRQFPKQI